MYKYGQARYTICKTYRRNRNSPKIESLSVLSDNVARRVIDLRNSIEHLEERILNGKIAEGEPTTLFVKSDSIELTGIEIFYSDLADWIN